MKGKLLDLSGEKFGRLRVMSQADDYVEPKSKKHFARWNCLCDCGNYKTVTGKHLKSGAIQRYLAV